MRIGIVGLGLIGGSLAKLIQAHSPQIELFGLDQDLQQVALAQAAQLFTRVGTQTSTFPKQMDIVFVCTPIGSITQTVESISAYIESELILTDVASLKNKVTPPRLFSPKHHFIPGHPMAGTEKSGFEHSRADILSKATYFLCPPSSGAPLKTLTMYLTELGFKVVEISTEHHDQVVGLASHFPYLMAALTVSVCGQLTEFAPPFSQAISSGFKDTTRVASSLPLWGVDVATGNAKALIPALDEAMVQLNQLKTWIVNENRQALTQYFSSAKENRERGVST